MDLGYGWRLVLAFAADDEIVLLELAAHDNQSDPYMHLAEFLELPRNAGHRGGSANRVPCCDEGEPPIVDLDLRDRIEAAFKSR